MTFKKTKDSPKRAGSVGKKNGPLSLVIKLLSAIIRAHYLAVAEWKGSRSKKGKLTGEASKKRSRLLLISLKGCPRRRE